MSCSVSLSLSVSGTFSPAAGCTVCRLAASWTKSWWWVHTTKVQFHFCPSQAPSLKTKKKNYTRLASVMCAPTFPFTAHKVFNWTADVGDGLASGRWRDSQSTIDPSCRTFVPVSSWLHFFCGSGNPFFILGSCGKGFYTTTSLSFSSDGSWILNFHIQSRQGMNVKKLF